MTRVRAGEVMIETSIGQRLLTHQELIRVKESES